MKKQLHTLLFMMLMPLAVMAQDNDFGMNYSAGITKKIDKKWSVGGELEMRTCNNTQTFSRFSGAVEGQYKFTKWLKASAEYKFLYDRRNEKLNEMSTYRPSYFTPRHRVSVSLTADATKGRFKFSLRERWQYTYRPEKTTERYDFAEEMWEETVVRSKAHNVMRSRFQVEYDIAKCKFDPYVSVELFNSMRLEKTRLTVEVEYKYKKQHVVNAFYRYENSNEANDEEDANMHIIGLGYQYKF